MTVGEFAEAVKKMRKLQKEYARTRNRYMRKEMEEAERLIDRLIEARARKAKQMELDL